MNEYEGVVKILPGRDNVNTNKSDKDRETLQCCATLNEHEGVVELVLLKQSYVNPDEHDDTHDMSLICATWNGHNGVVKILLGWDDVKPNKRNEDG